MYSFFFCSFHYWEDTEKVRVGEKIIIDDGTLSKGVGMVLLVIHTRKYRGNRYIVYIPLITDERG